MGDHHNHQNACGHHHNHGHHHHHVDLDDDSAEGIRRLSLAVAANMALTLIQVIGGLVSGSLSLIADALHNFSDAASLLIALIAIRIGVKPRDELRTFGYKRAETIAALINLTLLLVIGAYLMVEAIKRFYAPEPIAGWIVVIVAGGALLVDLYTAFLTYKQAKTSHNMRAAFIHNMTDALASVGVIVAGTLILLYGWVWTDALITLVISAYVLWHGGLHLPEVIHLLMEGTPAHLTLDEVVAAMQEQPGVNGVHHVHIWQLDERRNALEAHVVIDDYKDMDDVKKALKAMLAERFQIGHSTLEFEAGAQVCEAEPCC